MKRPPETFRADEGMKGEGGDASRRLSCVSLCKGYFRDLRTVTDCLHTFCRSTNTDDVSDILFLSLRVLLVSLSFLPIINIRCCPYRFCHRRLPGNERQVSPRRKMLLDPKCVRLASIRIFPGFSTRAPLNPLFVFVFDVE